MTPFFYPRSRSHFVAAAAILLAPLFALAGPLYIERMTPVETADTVLAEDEIVAVVDDASPVTHLRYGDGATRGGLIVASPYAVQTAYYRQLGRSEYTVVMGGTTIFTNGIYRLLPDLDHTQQAGNEGTLVIRPRDYQLISSVSYDTYTVNSTLDVAVTPDYTQGATNVVLTGTAQDIKAPFPLDVRSWVSNLTVYGWVGNHLIGATNDCRGNILLVRSAESDAEPLNLGAHNRLMAGHRAEDWNLYPATQTVDMAWQTVELSPYARITGDSRGLDIGLTTALGTFVTNAISIDYMGQSCAIVGYSLGATNVTLLVEASITMTNAPAIQRATSLSGTWTNVVTTTTWPAETWHTATSGRRYPVWTLSAARSPGAAEFFRVMGYPAAATNSVTINLPLVPAAGIRMGTNTIHSWAELKALLDSLP